MVPQGLEPAVIRCRKVTRRAPSTRSMVVLAIRTNSITTAALRFLRGATIANVQNKPVPVQYKLLKNRTQSFEPVRDGNSPQDKIIRLAASGTPFEKAAGIWLIKDQHKIANSAGNETEYQNTRRLSCSQAEDDSDSIGCDKRLVPVRC